MRKLLSSLCIALITPAVLMAQAATPAAGQPWNLQQCIEYALSHNIQVQQTRLNADLAQANLQQSKANVLPNLNATAAHSYQFGRTVDRFTNTFADGTVLSQNFFVSSNITLFAGGQNYNTIRQNQYAVQAGQAQVAQTQNDISLNVATAYLNVLFAEEQFAVAEDQVALTLTQVERLRKLVDAGASAKGPLLDLQAQLAQEELTRVNSGNNVTMAYLSLTQLMNLDSTEGFRILKPDLPMPSENIAANSPAQIYQTAMGTMPMIKKAQLDLRGAERGLKIAYGALSPRLSVQGSLGTGYSGLARDILSTSVSGSNAIGFTSTGDIVYVPQLSYETRVTPFMDQYRNNVNRVISFQLTVPIFNNLQTHTAITRARIQQENARLTLEQQEQQLRQQVDKAYTDAQAALQRVKASEAALGAAEEAFTYAQSRFEAGAIQAIDYGTAKNRVTRAKADLLQARFDYILKLKVLDFYQGKPLTF
ncbi:MAG: TolC family protein [Bacteroidetes bacterium]|nr:TolC family protein [Bacteroidota bacterium]